MINFNDMNIMMLRRAGSVIFSLIIWMSFDARTLVLVPIFHLNDARMCTNESYRSNGFCHLLKNILIDKIKQNRVHDCRYSSNHVPFWMNARIAIAMTNVSSILILNPLFVLICVYHLYLFLHCFCCCQRLVFIEYDNFSLPPIFNANICFPILLFKHLLVRQNLHLSKNLRRSMNEHATIWYEISLILMYAIHNKHVVVRVHICTTNITTECLRLWPVIQIADGCVVVVVAHISFLFCPCQLSTMNNNVIWM